MNELLDIEEAYKRLKSDTSEHKCTILAVAENSEERRVYRIGVTTWPGNCKYCLHIGRKVKSKIVDDIVLPLNYMDGSIFAVFSYIMHDMEPYKDSWLRVMAGMFSDQANSYSP